MHIGSERRASDQAVSAAENGRRDFNAPELFALAAVFGETIASIVTPLDPSLPVTFPTGREVDGAALASGPRGFRPERR